MSLKRKATEVAVDAVKKPKQNAAITSFFAAPKSTISTASTDATSGATDPTAPGNAPIAFDKDAWVAKLTPEQQDLLKLEIDTLHESWLGALKEEVVSKEFLDLKRFLKKEAELNKTVYPPMKDVYSWCASVPVKNPRLSLRCADPSAGLGTRL